VVPPCNISDDEVRRGLTAIAQALRSTQVS